MTRSELIERLFDRLNDPRKGINAQLMQKDCELCVRLLLQAMAGALVRGQRIEIRGFGTFSVTVRPPRVGRNPRSGEQVVVPEKRVPHFKPGKELRYRVDRSAKTQPLRTSSWRSDS